MPARKTTDSAAAPAADLKAIAAVNRRSVIAMAEMNKRLFRAMVSVQSEMLDFGQKRFARDMEAACELADCRRPEAALRVVQTFQTRAFEDYSREAGELMRLGAAAARAVNESAPLAAAPAAVD